MGCFSYLCKVCGKPINSDSERGEMAILFLLRNGKILESMKGEYDSYGRVFDENGESIKWNYDWSKAVDLHYSRDLGNGFAAFHYNCFKNTDRLPETRSNDDPDQGWGNFRKQKIPYEGGKKIDTYKSFPELKEIYKPTPEEELFQKTFKGLQEKFTSGNHIPVTLTNITKEEWNVIFPVLQNHYMDITFHEIKE